MKRFKGFTLALAVILFSATLPLGAEAHYLGFTTEHSGVAAGEYYYVKLSFTHEFMKSQWGYMPGMIPEQPFVLSPEEFATRINVFMRYANGSVSKVTGFKGKTESGTTKQVVDMAGTMKEIKRAHVGAEVRVEKEGTAVLFAKYPMNVSMLLPYDAAMQISQSFGVTIPDEWVITSGDKKLVAYPEAATMSAKLILNAENDGASLKRVLGDEYLEIVPLRDASDIRVGQEAKFKVFLNGKPLAGAEIEWADTKSETVTIPMSENGEGDENLQELKDKTDSEGVFNFTPRNAGLLGLGVEAEADGKKYATTLILDVQSAAHSEGSASGGGCDTGFGALALLLAGFTLKFGQPSSHTSQRQRRSFAWGSLLTP